MTSAVYNFPKEFKPKITLNYHNIISIGIINKTSPYKNLITLHLSNNRIGNFSKICLSGKLKKINKLK